MRRTILLCVVCFSATFLLAQTKPADKSNDAKSPAAKPSASLTPMNVKTGYWQNTQTISMSGSLGIPPELAAKLTPEQMAKYQAAMSAQGNAPARTTTSKGCLTQKDLTTNPFEQRNPDEKIQCHETVLNSTSSDVDVQISCTGEASMNYRVKIHAVDTEHATGTGDGTATMGGHTMNSNIKMDMKWLGATCPTDANHDN